MFAENIATFLAKHHTTLLCVGPEDCMKIDDLPLPLRLRNALAKSGFKTDDDIRGWLNGSNHIYGCDDGVIPGVGETGMRQLREWAAGASERGERGGPEVIRRPARREEPAEERAAVATLDERAEDYRRDDIAPTQSTAPKPFSGSSSVPGRWNQLVGDVSMRGGIDALREWMHVGDDQREATPRVNHQWDAPATAEQGEGAYRTTRVRDLASKLDIQRAAVKQAGGSTVIETDRGLLMLRLEAEIQDRLRAMIPVIKGLAHVKELGVEVSAETVGRMALIRGLDALERAHKVAPKAETTAPTPENREDQTPTPPPDDVEELSTPEGWTKCGPTDKIPVPEAVLHDYYTQNGWNRYWGMVDGTPIYFYWSPRRSLHGLDPFPGTDKAGRKVAEQETPWGPGHVVPTKWSNA
jgi:hypothetical protein